MDSEGVDANKDAQAAEVDDFNFKDILEDEPKYAFVQGAVECDKDSEVIVKKRSYLQSKISRH